MSKTSPTTLVSAELVALGARPATKDEAIRQAAGLLVAAGCIDAGYETSMFKRETLADTFLGHGVAIPHGLVEDRERIRASGIAVLQVPAGVTWNDGQTAYLVVAIAAQSDAHITVLRRLTRLIQDPTRLDVLRNTQDRQVIIDALTRDATADPDARAATDLKHAFEWTVSYPSGLHARPATRWVEAARAAGVAIRVRHGSEAADARNLVSLLELGLHAGDTVSISAEGSDAEAALKRFRNAIDALLASEKADADKAKQQQAQPARQWQAPQAKASVIGISASPGLAIGTVLRLQHQQAEIADAPSSLSNAGLQFSEALDATRAQLKALADDTRRRLGASDAQIFEAQSELLSDTDLITLACQLMVQGHGVAWSWHQAVERTANRLSALGNPVLAGRAADLRDVGTRVLAQIDPSLARQNLAEVPDNTILLAHDLAPSDTANLDTRKVAGLATAIGGPTSHTAILARTLGLPALVAGGDAMLSIADGTPAILDGQSGRLYLNPAESDLDSARTWIAEEQARRDLEAAERSAPALTRDGVRIDIGANINLPAQVPLALDAGAEGVGLMRTEFLFLERGETPTEDEQAATYAEMARALDGRPLIVRALDIGGDKRVAHLRLPEEENPFLGVRGARLLLRRNDLLEPQLRALYRAAREGATLSIMFPMITSVPELLTLRAHCERIRAELGAPQVPVGIMIEVPAAAAQADRLARHADFFSVGTNDLTQYVLAMDRQNPELAPEADSLHPAVLRMIHATVKGAREHDRWVGVCGGLAGDPFGAVLLAGLGVQELSMTPRDIAAVKARLRSGNFADFQKLALRALDCDSADEVRALEAELPASADQAGSAA